MANYELDIQLKNHAPVVVNFEPLKAELTTTLEDSKNKKYTEETIAEAKEDRAKLNKLKTVVDNERKARKNEYLKPLETFEKQMKELCSIIDEVTANIGSQLDTIEQKRIEEKRNYIRELYAEIGTEYDSLDFITLDKIFNDKWLNKTTTDKAIATEITEAFEKATRDLEVIAQMPNFSFEAKEVYKRTLDLNQAIAEGKRMSDIAEAKRQAALRKAQEEIEARKHIEELNNLPKEEPAPVVTEPEPAPVVTEKVYDLTFKCSITKPQAFALKQFCNENGIKLIRI